MFRVFAPPCASLARCSGTAAALWACPRASSRFAAFDCALRVPGTSALRASDGQRSGRECIFTFRTALRFACAVFRACALRVLGTSALRAFTFLQAFASTVRNRRSASLASSLAALVAHWAHFGLFPPQAAASVRPAKNARNDVHAFISDLSLVLPILCQCSAGAVKNFTAPWWTGE